MKVGALAARTEPGRFHLLDERLGAQATYSLLLAEFTSHTKVENGSLQNTNRNSLSTLMKSAVVFYALNFE